MGSFLVVLFESVGSIAGVVCTVAASAGGYELSAECRVRLEQTAESMVMCALMCALMHEACLQAASATLQHSTLYEYTLLTQTKN